MALSKTDAVALAAAIDHLDQAYDLLIKLVNDGSQTERQGATLDDYASKVYALSTLVQSSLKAWS